MSNGLRRRDEPITGKPQPRRFFESIDPVTGSLQITNIPALAEARRLDLPEPAPALRGLRPLEPEIAITPSPGSRRDELIQKFDARNRQLQAAGQQPMPITELQSRMKIEGIAAPAPSGAKSPVQSSKIMAGGLVQLVRKDGTTEVVSPDKAKIELVKVAEQRGAELQGLRAGERAEAKTASKVAADSFKGLSAIRKNIINMDEGIDLLDEGAKTGAIQSRLPSIRASSVKLDNLQGRLGLDVIGNTTFGALSESELKFALNTALPKGLNETELRQWLVDKRTAQNKLAEYLEEAAIFLGTPGNTIADFLTQKGQGAGAGAAAGVTAGGDLTSAEQAELEELRRRFPG